jgi:LmbE family N-acetylglucosaminyl deacetylase
MADVLPRILVIAAHPDDEVLLAGGTLAKYGGDVWFGNKGRQDGTDHMFDNEPLINWTRQIEQAITAHQPTVLITHHSADVNKDHRVIFEAVMAAARPTTYRGAIWCGEVPGSGDWWHERFTPNLFVELTHEQTSKKVQGMWAYESERKPEPHPRSVTAIACRAAYWGAIAMCDYAEPFQIIREIR